MAHPVNTSDPGIPPLDDTLGAIEIGGVVGTFLFGILTLQTYHYFRNFPKDPKLVTIMWSGFKQYHTPNPFDDVAPRFLELGHTISTWHLFISSPPRSLTMTILFSAPIYFIVQVFFANRIRVLSGRWFVTIICWALTFLRAVCTFAMLAVTLSIATLGDLEIKYQWLMATGLSLGVGVDVIVASSLCYCLWEMRSVSAKQTRQMVDTLIVWTIGHSADFDRTETGLLTGLFRATTNEYTAVTWFPFYLILAKSFSNSLLASLNGRQLFRETPKVVNIDPEGAATSLSPPSPQDVVFEMRNLTGTQMQSNDFTVSKRFEAGSGSGSLGTSAHEM
ncbi:hypothetical protein C8R47DRAFT_1082153 [Mycena vitilis]|nr:hypothetical protein C8R47DRAFT_1082153 [Mycena vitilis]